MVYYGLKSRRDRRNADLGGSRVKCKGCKHWAHYSLAQVGLISKLRVYCKKLKIFTYANDNCKVKKCQTKK